MSREWEHELRRNQIGLQIWTIRDHTAKDFRRAYEEVAGIGYSGVEIGDTGPIPPGEYKRMIDDLGLECIGIHISRDDMANDFQHAIDRSLVLGCKYIMLGCLQECDRRSADDYVQTADILSNAALLAAPYGISVAYHNHDYEFMKFGGRSGYDIFLDAAVAGKFNIELDVYWAVKGNVDPIDYIAKLNRRVPLLHMKDMEAGPERTFAPVGAGIIDIPGVVSAGDRSGVRWFIVEQDICKDDQLACAALSYRNLLSLCEPA